MSCAIAVMAKAPQPGLCKTRLSPPLSAADCAVLSAAFLRDVTENIALAARGAPIQGYVAYAPAGLERLFDGHLAAGTRLLLADGSRPKGFLCEVEATAARRCRPALPASAAACCTRCSRCWRPASAPPAC